jgi:hypothetical protein
MALAGNRAAQAREALTWTFTSKPCQHGGFGWHHGLRGGSGRLSSGRPTPARRWCAILHISYDTSYKHQLLWCCGQSSLAVCMRYVVRIQALCIFLQNILFAYVRVYTDSYPDAQCLYAYIWSCISIYVDLYQYSVIQSHTCTFADILSIYEYILICTEYRCCLLSGSQFSERFRQTKENIVYQSTYLYIRQHFLIFPHEWCIWPGWHVRFQKVML